jgi:RNA recognition motif-containing protein
LSYGDDGHRESRKEPEMAVRLYVGNLPYNITQSRLQEMFSPFGALGEVTVISDKFSGRSKGFGFVEFENPEEAKAAIEKMNGTDLDGRSIIVNEARPKEERPARSFGGR